MSKATLLQHTAILVPVVPERCKANAKKQMLLTDHPAESDSMYMLDGVPTSDKAPSILPE